jgi:lipopolysaccharide transport system permease protein
MTATSLTGVRLGHFYELVVHLARRELSSQHRGTLLGWAWPLTRQLAQLAVLVFVFSSLFDLDIENYPVFVFTGLLAFGWFASGVQAGSTSVLDQRHLIFQPRFPAAAVPVVAVTVPLVDVLVALPVLVVMLIASGDIGWTAVLLPPLLVVQLTLMCGLAWLCGAATVYLRDVPNIVLVAVTLLFYMTPVFYDVSRVPERYQELFGLNPLATLIECYRAVLIGSAWPSAWKIGFVVAAAAVATVGGLVLFRRLQPGFVDEL